MTLVAISITYASVYRHNNIIAMVKTKTDCGSYGIESRAVTLPIIEGSTRVHTSKSKENRRTLIAHTWSGTVGGLGII